MEPERAPLSSSDHNMDNNYNDDLIGISDTGNFLATNRSEPDDQDGQEDYSADKYPTNNPDDDPEADNDTDSHLDDDDEDPLVTPEEYRADFDNTPDEQTLFVSDDEEEAQDVGESSDEADRPAKKQKTSKPQKAQPGNKSKDQSNDQPAQGKRPAVKQNDSYAYGLGYRPELAPLGGVREWFSDLAGKLHELGVASVIDHLNGRSLKVATMCSGTESPILALEHISRNLQTQFSLRLEVEHRFSAEIVPYKQWFIERNFKPPVIFSDVTELLKPLKDDSQPRTATTAYGGKATVPGSLDILIAGFVCSDYSHLNNLPKVIEDRGESGDTFYAIKHYAQEFTPKIVILENVVSVPWTQKKAKKNERGLDKHFEGIGYASKHVVLDTKDFYVPQTRQRGYLVAIHRASFSGSDEELDGLFTKWVGIMNKLKRAASVPAQFLLLKSDDPKLKYSSIDDAEQKKKPADWEKCRRGYELYQGHLKLGSEHPVTYWAPGGFKQLPDYYKPFKGATDRVLDTIDISHKRCLTRGFDDRYHDRLIELSQNVYRITDTTKSGIVPCITPTGFPFSTARGGGITGYEALLFQALDADTLDVTNLSPSDLKSLAGNAMTSTVVGAVIGAAMLVFHEILNPGTGHKVNEEQLLPALVTGREHQPHHGRTAQYSMLGASQAVKLASQSRRMCYCEGRAETTTEILQQCSICCHTTCIACGKNPKHCYQRRGKHLSDGRMTPFQFEMFLKQHIPMCVRFNVDKSSPSMIKFKHQMERNRPDYIKSETWDLTIEAINNALSSDVYFREAIRKESWHIHFSSPPAKGSGSRLELVISDRSIEWLLYATAPSIEPLGSHFRKFLEKFPCARMRMTGKNIAQGTWELYMPELRKVDALVKTKGELVKSYLATAGLEDVPKPRIWDRCTVELLDADKDLFERDISGEYEHAPLCGQAFCSLYVKVSTKGSINPLFLVFDHEKSLQNPVKDTFIFTDDITRLEYGEYRHAFGRLTPDLHPSGSVPRNNGKESITIPLTVLLDEDATERQVMIYRDGCWTKFPDMSMDPFDQPQLEYLHLPTVNLDLHNIPCHFQQAIFCCNAEITCSVSDRWTRNAWSELTKSSEAAFFKEFRWLLGRGLLIMDHREETSEWQPVTAPKYLCYTCAPDAPKMLWSYTARNKQAPFENPQDASAYEHALKDRPLPLTVRYLIDDASKISVQLGIDSATLMHRAWGQLALTGHTDNIKVSWRLITDDNSSAKPVFKTLVLQDSTMEMQAAQPPGVVNHRLRDEQLRCLMWSIKQERDPQPFTEEAIVEDTITHINYRAEGKASREVIVRGGVLAHEVGFGKTLLVLGLVDSQSDSDQQYSMETVPGRIPVKATIVFCPPHLVDQWKNEAIKFLPDKEKNVVGISNFQQLKRLTIKSIQDAEIIIVNWKLVESESYTMAQAQFAGMVEPDTGASDRAFRCWYATAHEKFGRNVEELKSRPATFSMYLDNEFEKDKAATQSTEAIVPSKRLTGAAYKNKSSNSEGEEPTNKRKIPPKEPSLKDRIDVFGLENIANSGTFTATKCPLLELFSYARVVYDEYTYLQEDLKQALVVLESIQAHNRWILSGTPAMAGFSDIKEMAKYLGVNLGIKDYTLMKSDVLNRELRDMTRSEKFLAYRESPSPAWQMRRHTRAQAFLNHFARQDVADIGHLERHHEYVLIDQPTLAIGVYHELFQFLADSTFDLWRRPKVFDHKTSLIHKALFGRKDAEEVLIIQAAAHHRRLVGGPRSLTDIELCEKMIEIRKQQYSAKLDELKTSFCLALRLKLVDKDPSQFYDGFRLNVSNNGYGDIETSSEIQEFILQAETQPIDLPSKYEECLQLREISNSMTTSLYMLVEAKRSWRFAQAIKSIQDSLNGGEVKCSKCGNQTDPTHSTLLVKCGHLFCSHCLPAGHDTCMSPGCLSQSNCHNKILASDFLPEDRVQYPLSKIDEVIDLIQNGISKKDKVLVFVQYRELLNEVRASLKSNKIDSCDLSCSARSSRILARFQKAGSPTRVMTLHIGDASAAGSNLAMANHVIFVAPYHTTGSTAQHEYDSNMTQAVGRALRFGQEKPVYIHHFLVKYTADVDIIEFRKKKVLKMDGEEAILVEGDREESKFGTSFYGHICRDFE